MGKKVADQIVETLVDAGIKRIYAVTGDSLNELNDAVRRSGKIQWVHVRHEEVGAYAAGAEAELSGIACCAGSSGPGHVHLINGLYDANRANLPVLAIASTCATDEFGMEYFQETNTIKLFEDCSVYNQIATTNKQMPRMLQSALQHAFYKQGVAVLGMPGDVAKEDAVEGSTAANLLSGNYVFRPSDAQLKEVADILNAHSNVVVYCGFGAKDAHDELIEFATKLLAPIGYSFRGKMKIQYDNPYEVGMTGLLGLPSAYHAMHEADVIVLLGTDFPYKQFMPEGKTIIQVDIKPERIGRRAKVNYGLAGTVKDTLAALNPLLNVKEDQNFLNKQLKRYISVKEDLLSYASDKGSKHNISPEYVAATLDKQATDDAIFTVDTGMCCVWGARYINATGKRDMLGSFSHGSMANAMPQAIGAALAQPDRQVIALCGDGGLSMLLGDLATIVQYKLPVKIVVFDNRALGMVRLEMQVDGLPDWQTDMVNPDFAKVADAMGMASFTVDEPEALENTISEALAVDGPVLVHVFTNPNALAMPPKIDFEQVKGYAASMSKLMLSGKADEVFDIIKSNLKHIKDVL